MKTPGPLRLCWTRGLASGAGWPFNTVRTELGHSLPLLRFVRAFAMTWLFGWHLEPGRYWIRLFGCGVLLKDTSRHPLLFSQRLRSPLCRIGRWELRRLGH